MTEPKSYDQGVSDCWNYLYYELGMKDLADQMQEWIDQQQIMYHIAIVHSEEDYYESVASFKSYEDADAEFDGWREKLPHAWLDIVTSDQLAQGPVTIPE